jgi:hypothetical protein
MVLLPAVRVVPFAVLIRINGAYEFLETTTPPDWLAYACSSNLIPLYLCSAHPLWGHRTLHCPPCRGSRTEGRRSGGVLQRRIYGQCREEIMLSTFRMAAIHRDLWNVEGAGSSVLVD